MPANALNNYKSGYLAYWANEIDAVNGGYGRLTRVVNATHKKLKAIDKKLKTGNFRTRRDRRALENREAELQDFLEALREISFPISLAKVNDQYVRPQTRIGYPKNVGFKVARTREGKGWGLQVNVPKANTKANMAYNITNYSDELNRQYIQGRVRQVLKGVTER